MRHRLNASGVLIRPGSLHQRDDTVMLMESINYFIAGASDYPTDSPVQRVGYSLF